MNLRNIFGWLGRKSKNPRVYVAEKCGHTTKLVGEVRAYGEHTTTHSPLNEHGTTDWCFDCLGKMAIRCAWCGKPIFIGDPVTLYIAKTESEFWTGWEQRELEFVHDTDLGFNAPRGIAIYQKNPLQLVGCLRMGCADSGADRSGFWIPGPDGNGTVRRVMNPFEQAIRQESPVIISNLGDPSEAVPLPEGAHSLNCVRIIA